MANRKFHPVIFGLIIIVLLAIFPLIDLLNPGLPVTHDGTDHVARIANFYHSLSEGNIVPRWAEFLNWGYGHPILMFLYPFSSYSASFFHLIGFSYVDSLKIIFALGYIASGITMYLWMREQFDEKIGIASAALYLYAPYRFVDLYVRGAIGEHMAFIFPPLVLFFILRFYNAKKVFDQYLFLAGTSVSFSLLLLSHNAISLMIIPVIGFYVLWNFNRVRNVRKMTLAFLFLALGFMLAGFFIIPAFIEGKYTLRDIVIGEEYATRFVENPTAFIYGAWSYGITGQFTVQLGLMHLVGLILLPIVYLKKKLDRDKKLLIGGIFVFFVFSLFIQLSVSDFLYDIFTVFKKFQFPWRFLSLSLFALAVISPLFLLLLKRNHARIALVVLLLGLLVSTNSYWKAKEYKVISDDFYEKVYYGTTDTGESAPIWSVRFMEREPADHLEPISGEAIVQEVHRTSTRHSYKITVTSLTAKFRENTLYFPGWEVVANNVRQDVQFQDPSQRGLQVFELAQGEHVVDVIFKDTKLRMLANAISIISVIGIIVIGFFIRMRIKNSD